MGIRSFLNSLVAIIVLLISWYAIALFMHNPLLPQPHQVVYALIVLATRYGLVQQLALSLYRVLVGFALGMVLGLGIGVIVLLSRALRDIIYPLIAFIAVTPAFAFIPLLMLWIGLNDMLAIIAVIICTGFPLTYAIISGSKNIDPDIIDVALTLGARRRDLVFKIILPLTLTHIASMLKLEAGHSLRLVFVSEYLAISSGLGYLMMQAYTTIRVDEIIALIIVLGILALLLQYTIERVETKMTVKWGYHKVSRW